MQRVKGLSVEQIQKEFKKLRREIVTGDDTHMRKYMDDMALLAANAKRTHGMFKTWSFRNRMLLAAQTRKFGQIPVGLWAGTAQWAKLERRLRDGVTPKYIYRPVKVSKKKNEIKEPDLSGNTDGTDSTDVVKVSETTNVEETLIQTVASNKFMLTPVFDWSDTISTDPEFVEPDWQAPLKGGSVVLLDELVASSPVPVKFEALGGNPAHGFLTRSGITIDTDLGLADQIATLAHELTHYYLGHLDQIAAAKGARKNQVRAEIEQEAGLGEWLVCHALGLQTTQDTSLTSNVASYLRSWIDAEGNELDGHKARFRLLSQRLDRAMGAVETILETVTIPQTKP